MSEFIISLNLFGDFDHFEDWGTTDKTFNDQS